MFEGGVLCHLRRRGVRLFAGKTFKKKLMFVKKFLIHFEIKLIK